MKAIVRNNNGFTLLEIAIVLGIIAMISIVSAPSVLDWLPNSHLRSAAGELSANMQWTKLNAIKSNRDWGIKFDTANNQYMIMDSTDGNWSDGNDKIIKTVSLSSYGGGVGYGFGAATKDLENSTPSNTVSFTADMTVYNARGMSNETGYVYLTNNSKTAYGVGNNVSAYIFMRKWMGSDWQ